MPLLKNCNKNVKSFTYWSSFLKSIKNTIILYYTTKYKHLCKIIRCFRTTIVNAQYHASWANNSIFKQLILDTSHILILNLVITKINGWFKKNLFAKITSHSELGCKYWRFILLVLMKRSDFTEQLKQHRKPKTVDVKKAWLYTFNERYIREISSPTWTLCKF